MPELSLTADTDGNRISLIAISVAAFPPSPSHTLHCCLSYFSVCLFFSLSSNLSSLLPLDTFTVPSHQWVKMLISSLCSGLRYCIKGLHLDKLLCAALIVNKSPAREREREIQN